MTLTKQIKDQSGWITSFYTTDSAPHELGCAGPIKTIWDSKRAGAALPSWRSFQYEDFVGYHGWVAVEDIVSVEPFDAIFRLWGTGFVDLFKADLTGKKASDHKGTIYTESDFLIWSEVCRSKAILVARGSMDWVEQYHYLYNMEFTDITLPLSDDGNTVNRFLTVTLIEDRL